MKLDRLESNVFFSEDSLPKLPSFRLTGKHDDAFTITARGIRQTCITQSPLRQDASDMSNIVTSRWKSPEMFML